VTNYLNADFAGGKAGSGVGHIIPYQAWLCADGYLLAGATNDAGWLRFCDAIERPDLKADPRFATTTGRREYREVLIPLLQQHFAGDTVACWQARMDSCGVPASPVHTIEQVVSNEQVLATEMVVRIHDHRGEPISLIGVPVKMSETPGVLGASPPQLGEHTRDVLTEKLGMSVEQIDDLMRRGVV